MKAIIFTLVLLLFFTSCDQLQNNISEIITIQNGKIEGYTLEDKDLHIFKGIPFAQPPIGEQRWKAPQSVKDWDGIKQCKEYSAIAMQKKPVPFWMWTSEFIAPAGNMSEDCLYLNIWTPAKKRHEKLPVMVYIHGGGFTSGSGSVPLYDGENIAQKGIVFVTINYRVGIFGFFSHPELTEQSPNHTSGNQGLLDQVAALKWIHQNIEAFGGNPENVTIAGQSAGAFSVSFLKASSLCNGLVHKAIAESGGATLPGNRLTGSTSLSDAEQSGLKLQELSGVNSLFELQQLSAEEIMKYSIPAMPIIDGYFINKSVYEIYKSGEQNDIPLITGWNEDEGLGDPFQNARQYIDGIKANYGDKSAKILSALPANTAEEAKISQGKLYALGMFGTQTYNWMLMQNEYGTADVFVYHFTRDIPYGEDQQDFGAFHSGELGYAYNNLEKSKVRPWTASDRKLADQMSDYWVNFAKAGNPNSDQLPVWPSCKTENEKVMKFDVKTEVVDFPDLKALKVLRNIQLGEYK